jgi:hypothetical protein
MTGISKGPTFAQENWQVAMDSKRGQVWKRKYYLFHQCIDRTISRQEPFMGANKSASVRETLQFAVPSMTW